MWLANGLWTLRQKKNRNAVCRLLWSTLHTFPQNASAVQLAVSQYISSAAVMCRPAHARPVLPFVPSANNCQSEHIHKMLLSDVAVTISCIKKIICGSYFGEEYYTKCLSVFVIEFKISPNFELCLFCIHIQFCSRVTVWNKRKNSYQ